MKSLAGWIDFLLNFQEPQYLHLYLLESIVILSLGKFKKLLRLGLISNKKNFFKLYFPKLSCINVEKSSSSVIKILELLKFAFIDFICFRVKLLKRSELL